MMWIINVMCCSIVSRLLGMLDDFEDDVVGLATMDEAPQQSDRPSGGKGSKQRTLSQMAKEAGSCSKRSKVCKHGYSTISHRSEVFGAPHFFHCIFHGFF